MTYSKAQKNIIQNIVNKEIRDLNSFYSYYFKNSEKESLTYDITGNTKEQPDLPSFCSIENTTGIVLNEREIEKVIEFILLWKDLEKSGLITTYDTIISPFIHKDLCFIPLLSEDKRNNGKFNNDAFYLTKDYLNKVILVTDNLQTFVKNKYLTKEERKDKITKRFTVIALIISFLGILASSIIQICFSGIERKIVIVNDSTIKYPRKILILNSILDSNTNNIDSSK